HECFFRRGGPLSGLGRERLLAFRNAVLLQGQPQAAPIEGFRGPCLFLLELLQQGRRTLKVTSLVQLLRGNGAVRFEEGNGALIAGDVLLGEVPVGTKEYFLLDYLAQNLDHYVPYGDVKQFVLQQSGSTD